jgi:hypothetical protein
MNNKKLALLVIVVLNFIGIAYTANIYKFITCKYDEQCTSDNYRLIGIPVFPIDGMNQKVKDQLIGFYTLDGDSKK